MGGGGHNRSLFTYETLVHAVSGAAGSVVAMATFFPLDTVRSRLQLEEGRESKNTIATIRELTSKEGPHTLYRGIVPVLQSLCASNFVYFYTFHGLKLLRSNRQQTAGNDLLIASIAGVINVLTTTPLWVVNTRLKMRGIGQAPERNNNEYNTLYDGLIHIWKYEGLQNLWAGTLPSLMLVVNPAIQFMTYESIKRKITASLNGAQPPGWMFFVIGAIAKTIATALTYPLQLIQTKLRHGHKYPNLPPNAGTLQILFHILKKQGPTGLYKGMEAKLLQTVLTAALMFLAYEKISRFVFRILMHRPILRRCNGKTPKPSHFRRKLKHAISPRLKTDKIDSKSNDVVVARIVPIEQRGSASKKIDHKRSKAILKFFGKLKARRNKRQLESSKCKSVASVRSPSHVEETMSARSQRGARETTVTRKFLSPRIAGRSNRCANTKPAVICYDYDAAISKPDISNFLDFKKNGTGFRSMAKSQGPRSKSQTRKSGQIRPPSTKKESLDNDTEQPSGISEEERDPGGKENVTSNGTAGIEMAPVISKKNVTADDKVETCKGTENGEREIIECSGENQISRKKVRNENSNDSESGEGRSPILRARCSKIPRAKITLLPVPVLHESHSGKTPTTCDKAKNCVYLASSTTDCKLENIDVPGKRVSKPFEKFLDRPSESEVVRIERQQKNSKVIWNDERTSGIEADEEPEADRSFASTDESPAIIGSAGDPCAMKVLRTRKLNCQCRSWNDQDSPSSIPNVEDTCSDFKSSSPAEIRKKKWSKPLKHRKYIDTSSDDMDISSDSSRENIKTKKKNQSGITCPSKARDKSNLQANNSQKLSTHRRTNLSFFSALFDIVFWPYLFLRANR